MATPEYPRQVGLRLMLLYAADLPRIADPESMARQFCLGRPSISVPGLGRVSRSDAGLAELILRVGPREFFGRAILERPVRPTLVILTPPDLDPVVSLPQ